MERLFIHLKKNKKTRTFLMKSYDFVLRVSHDHNFWLNKFQIQKLLIYT